jgi:DNA repair photolyase
MKEYLIPLKGRGASSNPTGRYEQTSRETFDDGWSLDTEEDGVKLRTTLLPDSAKSVINSNDSPDVGFELSINPYRGCEHGCAYCFARPSHAYLGLSPGLDFETRLFFKENAAELLRKELSRSGHRPRVIALGINTDAYQPVERKLRITRELLKVLLEFRHPVSIVTKSALIERDVDLLSELAGLNLTSVYFSVTTLDSGLTRRLEPRAAAPAARLKAMARLSALKIPTGVLVAPVIPALTDAEMECILGAATEAGAKSAGYVILRLPHELKELFRDWLAKHEPGKASHVMSVVRSLHGGKDYDATFGVRMSGRGQYADLLARRFELACHRLGLNESRTELDCSLFRVPGSPVQLGLL